MPRRASTILKYSSEVCALARPDALALEVLDLAGRDARALARDDRERFVGVVASGNERFIDGKRPVLLLETPPQHGKSLAVIDFLAWCVGRDPHLRVVYTSFSDRLSIRANLRMQRALDSEKYKLIFPDTHLDVKGGHKALRNYDILEFIGTDGYFRTTPGPRPLGPCFARAIAAIDGRATQFGIDCEQGSRRAVRFVSSLMRSQGLSVLSIDA